MNNDVRTYMYKRQDNFSNDKAKKENPIVIIVSNKRGTCLGTFFRFRKLCQKWAWRVRMLVN